MSETCDVNLLVYATNVGSPQHRTAASAVERLAAGPGLTYLFWPVLMGYLRLATNTAVAAHPLSVGAALANVEQLVARPNVRVVGELDGFWPAFRAVADDVAPRGNLVPDAHLVALMHQHGVGTIWTHDRDFRKFTGITVRDPFAS